MEPGRHDTIDVHVQVSGQMCVPLQKHVIESLRELGMEESIVTESIRLAVAEKLGGFDDLSVRLGSGTTGRSEASTPSGVSSAVVNVRLDSLSRCIVRIQEAFTHLVEQTHELHALLTAVEEHCEENGLQPASEAASEFLWPALQQVKGIAEAMLADVAVKAKPVEGEEAQPPPTPLPHPLAAHSSLEQHVVQDEGNSPHPESRTDEQCVATPPSTRPRAAATSLLAVVEDDWSSSTSEAEEEEIGDLEARYASMGYTQL